MATNDYLIKIQQLEYENKESTKFIKKLLMKLAMTIGLNDKELIWLNKHGERIADCEVERLNLTQPPKDSEPFPDDTDEAYT